MIKLENYYRERVAQLTEQENAQKKLRVHCRYSRLPKLPTEIIIQILSYLHVSTYRYPRKNTLNTPIPDAISVMVKGLLPHLVLKPCLELPPHCKDFNAELDLVDIGKQDMEISILTDPDILWSISLEVGIRNWEIVRDQAEILQLLLRVPHRWKKLSLSFSSAESVMPMLKTFEPCFRNLKKLALLGDDNLIEAQVSLSSVEHVVTGSIEKVVLLCKSHRMTGAAGSARIVCGDRPHKWVVGWEWHQCQVVCGASVNSKSFGLALRVC